MQGDIPPAPPAPPPGGMDSDVPPPPTPGPWDDEGRRNLREVAKSTSHLLCHKEYNKWCDGCVCGKTRDAPHYVGGFKREITNVGFVLIGDPTPMWDAVVVLSESALMSRLSSAKG